MIFSPTTRVLVSSWVVGLLLSVPAAADHDGTVPIEVQPHAAVGGGTAVFFPRGSALLNLWDVHGGTSDHPNLDIGAGGDGGKGHDPRGSVVINHDVGKCFDVQNGYMLSLFRACGPTAAQRERGVRGTIRFYVPLKVLVDGRWRRARVR